MQARLLAAGLLLAGGLWPPLGVGAAACPSPEPGEVTAGRLAHVIDGDTLILEGGARVRLIGIDAPEVGRDGAPDKPFAAQAQDALRQLTGRPGARLKVQLGAEREDRHGRSLADVFDSAGNNLAEQLLHRGLAYVAAIPPNLRYIDCFLSAQAAARRERRGLWRAPPLDAERLPAGQGFMRVSGRVEGVRSRRQGLVIELRGGLVLNIHEADLPAFRPLRLEALPGHEVEALGWVHRGKGGASMRLRHPSGLMLDRSPP